MIVYPELPQRSDEWFKIRQDMPTASTFKSIITESGKDAGGWDDYALSMMIEPFHDDCRWEGNAATRRGTRLEPEAFAEIDSRLGAKGLDATEVGFCVHDDKIAGCSPDGLVMDADGYYVAGIEIKCPSPTKHARNVLAGEMPSEYKQQIHGSMVVTGIRTWYFLSYCPGLKPLICRIEWNSYTDKVESALRRFSAYYHASKKQNLEKLIK